MRLFAGRTATGSCHRVAPLLAAAALLAAVVPDAAAQAPLTWAGFYEVIPSRDAFPGGPTVLADAPVNASRHAVSSTGQYVVFDSAASNMGGAPTAVYRKNRQTGTVQVVQAGWVRNGAISSDGNHVAFEVCQVDFASPCQVYARDMRTTAPAALLSATVSGSPGLGDSLAPVLSGTGRYVVYVTTAPNLSNDGARRRQIMWRDRDADGDGIYDEAGAVANAIVTTFGNGDSDSPEVSDDGFSVAFRSAASNLLGATDTNGVADIFLRTGSPTSGTLRRLNLRPGNQQSPFAIVEPQISMSADGRTVAFASADPLLTTPAVADTNGTLDVFLYQVGMSTLTRVDVGRLNGMAVPGNGPTGWPTVNQDGRYVSLQSAATNGPALSTSGAVQVYVVDRVTSTVTRISDAPDPAEGGVPSLRPTITAFGSLVLFWSSATSFAGIEPPAQPLLHAAARLRILGPTELFVPAGGGLALFRLDMHGYTRLRPTWDESITWVSASVSSSPNSETWVLVTATANTGAERSVAIRLGTQTVTVTQRQVPTVTSISPTSGPMAGGTILTIRGTGFTSSTRGIIGPYDPGTTFVDDTTLQIVTPRSDFPQSMRVGVQQLPDYTIIAIPNAFTYVDDGPPVLVGTASGPLGLDGWFVGDVTVSWQMSDGDGPITSTTCATVVVTEDTAGATHACTATSAGGTTAASVVVKRDATPPVVTVTSPRPRQLVEAGAALTGDFSCTDATSGLAECGLATPSGTPLDTQTPGWHVFATTARDLAGHVGSAAVEYAVSTGVCMPPVPGLKNWLRFEDNLADELFWVGAQAVPASNLPYTAGVAGRAHHFTSGAAPRLEMWPFQNLTLDTQLSLALWIAPDTDAAGRLLDRPSQFGLGRDAAGRLVWTLVRPDGVSDSGTSIGTAPSAVWTHVALTYDAGVVALYLNGRLDRTWTSAIATLHAPTDTDISVGGSPYAVDPYVGKIDELQIFNRAIAESDVEALFLAGSAGTCRPAPTTLTVLPSTAAYGAGTFVSMAILRDGNGLPIAGKTIRLDQLAVPYGAPLPVVELVTDAEGAVRWDAPFSVGVGTYAAGVRAHFGGDFDYRYSDWVWAGLTVTAAPSTLTWATPAPIVYGTALSAAQLNATGSVAGSITYTPGAGTVLGAGVRALDARLVPSSSNYTTTTASVTLTVGKGVPVMALTDTTVTYTGLPQPVTAAARDYRGWPLAPVTVTYDGAAAAPVAAGVYAVVASFAGDANHEPATASATLTIAKATPAIAFSSPTTVTFDGQPHAVSATVTGAGGVGLGTAAVTYAGSTTAPVDAGSYLVSATFDGNANYAPRTATTTLTITKATPALVFAPLPATFTYDGLPHGVAATVVGVGGTALGAVPVTYNGAAAEPIDAGVYTASASFAGSANYLARTQTTTVTVQKALPTIVFAGASTFTYDGEPHALTATATGAGGIVLGPVAVTYNGSATAPAAVGSYTAASTFPGNGNYASRTATTTLTIAAAAPVLTITGGPFVYDGSVHPATVVAAGVGGQTPPGAVTITYNGSAAQPVNAGTYTVVASIAAAGNYAAATATGSLVVTPATPAITWVAPDPITYGTALSGLHLRAGTYVAGTWEYTPAAGTVLDASPAQTLSVTFTPSNANYTPATTTRTIEVRKAVPIVGAAFYNVFYDGQPHAASAGARGVTWEPLEPITVTYNGSTDVPVNAGVYVIVTSYPGSANYEAGSSTITREIYRSSVSSMSWGGAGSMVYGTPLGASHLSATASLPGTFTYTPGPGTVLDAGSHVVTAVFTPADPNYDGGSMTRTMTVFQATPAVTVAGGSFTYDGQPHGATATVTGVGGATLGPATLTYAGSPTPPVAAGTYAVVATFAGDVNYRAASGTGTVTIAKAAPVLSWSAPGAIGYGTPLGAGQLSAVASAPGTFVYSQSAGTVLGAGGHSLTATFTPSDPGNYAGGSIGTTLTVVRAALTVQTNDVAKVYGAALPGFTASFAGLVAGDTPASLGGALAFATAATASSPVGTYAVTPLGLSSPNYTIAFANGVLSVVKAPVAMTLSASPTPSGLDMPITFTASVAAAQSAPTAPVGTVRFFDGATLLGTATLSGDTATLLTGGLTAGSHTIEARYDGDASFAVGSRTATHVVNAAAATPAITLTTSRQPAATSQSMTFTATITVATSGTIAFYDGGALLGSGAIGSGAASLTVASLTAGSHAITARFQGNASAPPVISPVLVQSVTNGGSWKDRTSSLALVSSANPAALGAAVTFTATASGSSGTPAGRILFMVDGLVVGDPTGVAMSGSGQASVSLSTLNGGRHKVTATYLGSSNYRGSSGALTQTVN